jgi:predicted amidohydrolase
MIAAAVQYRPPKGKPEKARCEIADFAARACLEGAGIVVFPEMATTGYIWESKEALRPFAEPADGDLFTALAPVAVQYGTWIICGFPEISGSSLFNSALIISPDGKLCACYRKILLFDADMPWADPGDTRYIINTAQGALVPGICMDLNDDGFTGFVREHDGAVVPFCTNWLEEGLDVHVYWRLRLEGFNGSLIAANSWGFDGATEFCGRSSIFGPGMKCLASAGREGNEIILAEI